MRKSNITITLHTDIQKVWNLVTDNNNFKWRSDLSSIEIIDDKKFVEYTKNGFSTEFIITKKDEFKQYEFNMNNKNMVGHWIGIFSETEFGGTKIDFTEEIHIKNPIMELLSYLFMNIKKMQEKYVEDLKRELRED